jgi:hypothetical protein
MYMTGVCEQVEVKEFGKPTFCPRNSEVAVCARDALREVEQGRDRI